MSTEPRRVTARVAPPTPGDVFAPGAVTEAMDRAGGSIPVRDHPGGKIIGYATLHSDDADGVVFTAHLDGDPTP